MIITSVLLAACGADVAVTAPGLPGQSAGSSASDAVAGSGANTHDSSGQNAGTAISGGPGQTAETFAPGVPVHIAEIIIATQEDAPTLYALSPEDDYFTDYLKNIYLLQPDEVVDGVIYYADGMLAYEIAVLLFQDSASAASAAKSLTMYKEGRSNRFAGYAPEQAAMLENGAVAAYANCAALFVCENPKTAESVFLSYLAGLSQADRDGAEQQQAASHKESGEEPTPARPGAVSPDTLDSQGPQEPEGSSAQQGSSTSQGSPAPQQSPSPSVSPGVPGSTQSDTSQGSRPGDAAPGGGNTSTGEAPEGSVSSGADSGALKDDLYDPQSIIAAWQSGDKSGLSYKNRSIFDACVEIIGALIHDSMSDYEKELAINDWMVDWASYDQDVNSNSPNASPDPNNDNPYGFIYGRKAICSGYASTFQLFMDLLGIECIYIRGESPSGEHNWNMVRLDGNWYCVDVTWNDPTGGRQDNNTKHRFFNVTTQFMKDTGHVWDESATPIADSGKYYIE